MLPGQKDKLLTCWMALYGLATSCIFYLVPSTSNLTVSVFTDAVSFLSRIFSFPLSSEFLIFLLIFALL